MKILPSNQSLILVGEPGGPRGRPPVGGALQRVTILTARQESTVVVRADYFSHDEPLPFDSRLPDFSPPANDALTADAAKDTPPPSRVATISSYLSPIELYTRTQRGLEDTSRPALLDVLA